MDFQQIRDFVNPAVAQATGLQEVENLSMPVPVAYVPVQLVIDGALSLTSENPVQNKVIAVAIQNLDGRITAIEGQFSEGVTEAVNNWLAAHPEATTTVQDGAITYAKLDANLKGEVDQISELKSGINVLYRSLHIEDFEQGSWSANAKRDDPNRIRTKNRIEVNAGDCIIIEPKGLYFSVAIYANESSTTPLQTDGWVGGSSLTIVPIYFTGVAVIMAANAATYAESTSIVPSDFVSTFDIWNKQIIDGSQFNLKPETLSLATTDFVAGIFVSTNGQSLTSTWNRTAFNIHEFSKGIIQAKVTPASGQRVVVVVFSERPDYSNNADNSAILVNAYSGTYNQVIRFTVNPNYYYVIETNADTSNIANLPTVDVLINAFSAIEQEVKSKYADKKLSVMGDSISSYSGVSPSGTGYAAFYPKSDVQSHKLMWWSELARSLGMEVLKINANSGSTVSTANTTVIECSSDERTSALNNGASNPDIIICECGLNDYYMDVALGSYDGTQPISDDRSTFKNAYASMLNKMQTNYPNAEIFCCTITQNVHSGYLTIDNSLETVVNSGGQRLVDYNNAIKELASMFGCKVIDMEKCGFTLKNLASYTVDASPNRFHPNVIGHKLMAEQAYKDM